MKRILLLSLILVAVIFSSCNQSTKNKEMVRKDVFGTHNGKEVYLLTLTNKAGNVIRLTNYGAKINWIEVPDKNGKRRMSLSVMTHLMKHLKVICLSVRLSEDMPTGLQKENSHSTVLYIIPL